MRFVNKTRQRFVRLDLCSRQIRAAILTNNPGFPTVDKTNQGLGLGLPYLQAGEQWLSFGPALGRFGQAITPP